MSARAPELAAAEVAGPIFVLVGSASGLKAFLEAVPSVDASRIFVDGAQGGEEAALREFPAYDAVGFTRLEMGGEGAAAAADAAKALKPPALSLGEGWRYLTNSIKLSPIPEGLKFGDVPPGVLQLGGTFLVKGGRVARAWADPLPGAHPAVADVVAEAVAPA